MTSRWLPPTGFFRLLSLALLGGGCAQANVWTVDCGVLATQRMDPIVFPGWDPAGHVHTIAGASRFNETLTYEGMQSSRCTTCNAVEDKSNYWIPQMYVHKASTGKFHYVDMRFAVYYKLQNEQGSIAPWNPLRSGDIKAFPKGFRMLAGSPTQTTSLPCINHKCVGDNGYNEDFGSLFPTDPTRCTGFVRLIHQIEKSQN